VGIIIVIIPFHQERKQSLEKLINLPSDTQIRKCLKLEIRLRQSVSEVEFQESNTEILD
jgi:hypothetical protein